MNFREAYRKYNEAIFPDVSLVANMKEEAEEWKDNRKRGSRRVMRDVLAAAAACACIFIGLPAVAANFDPLYDIMYRVSPRIARYFRPVQTWDEEQGIRMAVEAVYVHGNELQAYISLQDLEGHRIDGTTDIAGGYTIHTPVAGYGGGGYALVEYDEETGKAFFLITVGQLDQDIQGEELTLSLRRIFGQKQEYENLEIPIPWSEVQENPETMELWISGSGGPNSDVKPKMWAAESYDREGNVIEVTPARYSDMLLPREPDGRLSVEGIEFTGMGYIDGVLHIQTMVYDCMNNDNHCELFLRDDEGNLRIYDYKISGEGEPDGEGRVTGYQDCLFAVTPEELEQYTLCGDFYVSRLSMTGSWSVAVPVGEAEER